MPGKHAMKTCEYCKAEFRSDKMAHHLAKKHADELSSDDESHSVDSTMSSASVPTTTETAVKNTVMTGGGGASKGPLELSADELAAMSSDELMLLAKKAKAIEKEDAKREKEEAKRLKEPTLAMLNEMRRKEAEEIDKACYRDCERFIRSYYVFEKDGVAPKREMDELFYKWRDEFPTHTMLTYYDLFGRREGKVINGLLPTLLREGKITDGGNVYCGLRRR